MAKGFGILIIALLYASCKTNLPTPKAVETNEPSFAYKQQMENLEEGIYFRGSGNEPRWSLKISEKNIQFTSLKSGYESLSGHHTEPLLAMDANVKMYRVPITDGTMIVQIMQQECINTMSGDKSSYSVRIEIVKDNKSEFFNGCGNYITDFRLHDIWVLEKINGENVTSANYAKEIPNLEINSTTNTFMGSAGCNRVGGDIFFERGLLRFININSTEMVCADNNNEAVLLKTLQSITKYKVENLRLILTNSLGNKLIFKKVD